MTIFFGDLNQRKKDGSQMDNKRTRHSKGFTLLEVLIAMVILSIGILGHMALQTSVINARSFSKHLGGALAAGARQMEEFRCTIFDLIEPGITVSYTYNDGSTAAPLDYSEGRANKIESTVEGFDSIGLPYHPEVDFFNVNMLKTNTEWVTKSSHYSSSIFSFESGGKTVDQEQGIINLGNIF